MQSRDPDLAERRMDGSFVKRGRVELIARHIVEQQRLRIKTTESLDPVWFIHYKAMTAGRRCSCWTVEDSSSANCRVCYATGVVGAYQKVGFEGVVIDCTAPNLILVNTIPWPDGRMRPTPFTLIPGALRGWIEFTVRFRSSFGLDVLTFAASNYEGTSTKLLVKSAAEADFVDATDATVNARLTQAGGVLNFKVEMSRTSIDHEAKIPLFQHLFLRHRTKETYLIPMDIPKESSSIALAELGVVDAVDGLHAWVSAEYGEFKNEDFLVNVGRLSEKMASRVYGHAAKAMGEKKTATTNGLFRNKRASLRFKVQRVEKTAPLGVHLSTDLDIRYVNAFESIAAYPL